MTLSGDARSLGDRWPIVRSQEKGVLAKGVSQSPASRPGRQISKLQGCGPSGACGTQKATAKKGARSCKTPLSGKKKFSLFQGLLYKCACSLHTFRQRLGCFFLFRGTPSILEADDFLGACCRKAMTPKSYVLNLLFLLLQPYSNFSE